MTPCTIVGKNGFMPGSAAAKAGIDFAEFMAKRP
jgi:hypothetical protein